MILNEPAAQKEAFNLASLLTNVNPYNLSKPDIHRRAVATNDDILEAFSGLRIGLRILINPKFFSSFATSTRTREGEFCESIKKGLPTIATQPKAVSFTRTCKIRCRDWRPDNLYSADTH